MCDFSCTENIDASIDHPNLFFQKALDKLCPVSKINFSRDTPKISRS